MSREITTRAPYQLWQNSRADNRYGRVEPGHGQPMRTHPFVTPTKAGVQGYRNSLAPSVPLYGNDHSIQSDDGLALLGWRRWGRLVSAGTGHQHLVGDLLLLVGQAVVER